MMAGSTRFELATSCVTGRRSNQLNYDPAMLMVNLSGARGDVNPVLPGSTPADRRAPASYHTSSSRASFVPG
jgi:hypothetical protein